MVSMIQTLSAQWLTDSLKVTAIGLIVVFAVLAILIALIEALHFVLKERKTEQTAPTTMPKNEERISAGVMAEVPDADKAQDDPEFIAAISSAITCVTGNANFKIKSIKKG